MPKYLERVVGFEVTPPDNTIFKVVEGKEPSFLSHTSHGTLASTLARKL
jgi:hypothetical protein